MAPVAGSALLGFWEPPKTPIALMDIHGTLDDTIPANASNVRILDPLNLRRSTATPARHYQPHGLRAVFWHFLTVI